MRLEKIPNFISKEERKQLIDWMDKAIEDNIMVAGLSRGKLGYSKRKTTRIYDGRPNYPEVAYKIQKRLIDKFEWTNKCFIEPMPKKDGMLAVITYPGGDTYKHRDPKMVGSAVRFNIILQKPESGGELYVEGENFDSEEGELHCYNVTEQTHWVTEVEGSKPRYLWIFGMSVPYSDWEDGKVKQKVE